MKKQTNNELKKNRQKTDRKNNRPNHEKQGGWQTTFMR